MVKHIRLLVVDDSIFVRRAVERMASQWPEVEVVGSVADGREAVELSASLQPDVILLDVNMPEMDGLEALRRIMARSPTPVVLMSTLTRAGADITVRGLELGAVDFVDKSRAGTTMDLHSLAPVLREKLTAAAEAQATAGEEPADAAAPERELGARRAMGRELRPRCPFDVVVVGASTGGPRALAALVPALPEDFGASVAVAQHMPPGFTGTLAERLHRRSRVEVLEGEDGTELLPGRVVLVPGGRDGCIEARPGGPVLRVGAPTSGYSHHPSVDALLSSAARTLGSRAVGVILTGMGEDGAAGLAELRRAGGRTLAESEETTVIYGMPRAAREAAEQVLPLNEMAAALVDLCRAPAERAP